MPNPPRKLRQSPEERALRLGTRMAPGSIGGRIESAAPAAQPQVRAQVATFGTGDVTEHVEFTITGTLSVVAGTSRWYCPYTSAKIEGVIIGVNTAPTGASIKVDVNKNGTTIFTTQANRPTIAISANEAVDGGIDVPDITADDYLQVDIDQVGSTVAGADLVVVIKIRLLGTSAGTLPTQTLSVAESDGTPDISDVVRMIFLQSDSVTNMGDGSAKIDLAYLKVEESDGTPSGKPLVLRFPPGSLTDLGSGKFYVSQASGSVATDTIFDAKGDLPVGTGADTAAKLTVGANGLIPIADSTQSTGIKWASASLATFSGARVTQTTNVSTGTATWTTYAFTSGATEDFDTDNYWVSGSPTIFTIPTTGYYLIHAYLIFAANATNSRRAVGLGFNGTATPAGTDEVTILSSGSLNQALRAGLSTVRKLTAADTVSISGFSDTSVNMTAGIFSIMRLGT